MRALKTSDKVLVIGAGAMGSGIAHVAAVAGHTVYLYDMQAEAVARGRAGIAKDLDVLVSRDKLGREVADAALARVLPIGNLSDAQDARLAIEAVVERLDVKQALFAELEAILAPEAILATNTSSLSITALAAPLARPGQVVGMHFFNPAPRMKLVEVVSGLATAPAVAQTVHATAGVWGKVPVFAKSTPGFIVNRVARPYYGEALRVLAEQAATPATLDAAMREGCGFPMGPFELMDLIGHDVNHAVSQSVYAACFNDSRYTPHLIQQELVYAGRLGRKSGQGFYAYGEGAALPAPADLPLAPAARRVRVVGDLGPAAALIGRLEQAGLTVERTAGTGHGWLEIGAARLMLSDGRTATRRAVDSGFDHVVLFDLCLDFAKTPRLTLSAADQCGRGALTDVVGTLQAASFKVAQLDDVAGLLALRTVAMLANEAADAVLAGIGSAADIDTAMRYGTNYPLGPLAWADRLGPAFIAEVLDHLRAHYVDTRYRLSPLLQRKALTGATFHAH
ncbi:3-hydroxyacyl-CoA dehydrogenase PaaH [Denitromonas sp.]|uniref:3-hydroxyacyl-CoA dehydrogenase PaaH n=1 Tax=Denitromonas sp. TaxID=2734609 RepID=UPI002B003A2D|nr:3-hydroxyacyl-CoA dehydrogenase PaaH [Denitromonas sp.]